MSRLPKNIPAFQVVLLIIIGSVLLLLPAVYNGYPLVNSDDGTYIWSGFKLEQPGDRPITYGLFLRIFSINGFSFWLPAMAQALIVSWLLVKILQRINGNKAFIRNSVLTLLLLALTSLSWTVSQIIPDIWTGISVLVVILIILNKETLPVKVFLYVLYFCAVATHMSNIMIFTLLLLFIFLFHRRLLPNTQKSALRINLLLLLATTWSTLIVMGSVSAKSKHVFLMASMVEKGILKTYLDNNCAVKRYGICSYKDQLPSDPNAFIWDQNSPLYQQGGWEATRTEYNKVVQDILTTPGYLLLFAQKSAEASWRQLFECHLAEGNYPFPEGSHVDYAVRENAARDSTTYRSAWQQQHNIVERLSAMNNIHYLLIIAGCLLLLLVGGRKEIQTHTRFIIITLLAAYLINIIDCATFAQVNARYGSRMIWVIPFAALLGMFDLGWSNILKKDGADKSVSLNTKLARLTGIVIIFIGIALRLAEWFHCRDLMMDEVNVVRNVFERNFLELLKPLNYEQFAPPLFLWALKLSGIMINYSEMAMRLFPVLCSCASLVLLYKLLQQTNCKNAFWYPLALFAFSNIYILYGNDVKQYASDALVALMLLHALYKTNDFRSGQLSFIVKWSLLGSLAIWLSMPSVFVLAGTGLSLLLLAIQQKHKAAILSVIFTGSIWILMFAGYYKLLLEAQIHSDYLQQFHTIYFLNVHPLHNLRDKHNLDLLRDLFAAATGNAIVFFLCLNLILLVLGFVKLSRDNRIKALGVLLPVICLLVAAALHHFTLIPRVCIFIMPVLLFTIGNGLEWALSFNKVTRIVFIVVCIIGVAFSQEFRLFYQRNEIDELNTGISFAHERGVPYENIYIPELYKPCVIYYTTMHPDQQRARFYIKLPILHFNENFSALHNNIKDRAGFVYFWIDDGTMQRHRDSVFAFLHPVDSLIRPSYKTFVLEK